METVGFSVIPQVTSRVILNGAMKRDGELWFSVSFHSPIQDYQQKLQVI